MCKTTDFLVGEIESLRRQARDDAEAMIARLMRERELEAALEEAHEKSKQLASSYENVSNAHKLCLLDLETARRLLAEQSEGVRDMKAKLKAFDSEASAAVSAIHALTAVRAWARMKCVERAPLDPRSEVAESAWERARRERRRALSEIRRRQKARRAKRGP